MGRSYAMRWSGLGLMLLVAAAVASGAWAKSFDDPKSGEPPFGVEVDGNAGGTKLNGVVHIRIEDEDNMAQYPLFVTLRLRQGNQLELFTGSTTVPTKNDPGIVQSAIQMLLADDIRNAFFEGEPVEIVVKSIDEFINVQVEEPPSSGRFTDYTVADVQLAAQ